MEGLNVEGKVGIETDEAQAELIALDKLTDTLEASFDLMTEAITHNLNAVEKAVHQVTESIREAFSKPPEIPKPNLDPIEQAFKTLGVTMQRTLDAAAREAQEAYDVILKSGTATPRELEQAWRAAQAAIARASQVESARVERNWRETGDRIGRIGSNFQNVGRDLTIGVTVPLVAAAGAVVKFGSDFETGFAGVRKTVDGVIDSTGKLTVIGEEIRLGIRKMAQEIPATVDEINKIAEAAGQLSVKSDQILKFSKVMVDLGNSTNLAGEEGAKSLARFAAIVQMPLEQIDKLGSTIAALDISAATSAQEITAMALRIAGAGHQIKLTEAQMLGFAAALSSVGIEAEAGGTAISRVFISLDQAVRKGGANLAAFAKVAGQSSSDFAKAFKKDAAGAITDFIQGLGEMQKRGENVFDTLKKLDLSDIRVRDALLRAAGAGKLFEDQIRNASKAWDENIALTRMAEERYKTLESQWVLFTNRLREVALTLFDAVRPALQQGMDALQSFAARLQDVGKWFAELSPAAQKTIIVIGGILAAIGPALVIFGSLAGAISNIVLLFSGFGGAAAAAGTAAAGAAAGTGVLGGSLAALSGPIGWVVGAVVALGIAYATNFAGIRDVVNDVVKQVMALLNDLVKAFTDSGSWLKTVWDAIGVAIWAVVQVIGLALKSMIDSIRIAVKLISLDWSGAMDVVTGKTKDAMTGSVAEIEKGKPALGAAARAAGQEVTSNFGVGLASVNKQVGEAIGKLLADVKQGGTALRETFNKDITKVITDIDSLNAAAGKVKLGEAMKVQIREFVLGLSELKLTGAGEKAIKSFIDGFEPGVAGAKEKLVSLSDELANAISTGTFKTAGDKAAQVLGDALKNSKPGATLADALEGDKPKILEKSKDIGAGIGSTVKKEIQDSLSGDLPDAFFGAGQLHGGKYKAGWDSATKQSPFFIIHDLMNTLVYMGEFGDKAGAAAGKAARKVKTEFTGAAGEGIAASFNKELEKIPDIIDRALAPAVDKSKKKGKQVKDEFVLSFEGFDKLIGEVARRYVDSPDAFDKVIGESFKRSRAGVKEAFNEMIDIANSYLASQGKSNQLTADSFKQLAKTHKEAAGELIQSALAWQRETERVNQAVLLNYKSSADQINNYLRSIGVQYDVNNKLLANLGAVQAKELDMQGQAFALYTEWLRQAGAEMSALGINLTDVNKLLSDHGIELATSERLWLRLDDAGRAEILTLQKFAEESKKARERQEELNLAQAKGKIALEQLKAIAEGIFGPLIKGAKQAADMIGELTDAAKGSSAALESVKQAAALGWEGSITVQTQLRESIQRTTDAIKEKSVPAIVGSLQSLYGEFKRLGEEAGLSAETVNAQFLALAEKLGADADPAIAAAVKKIATELVGTMQSAMRDLEAVVGKGMAGLIEQILKGLDAFDKATVAKVGKTASGILEVIGNLPGAIGQKLKGATDAVLDWVNRIDAILRGMHKIWDRIPDGLGKALEGIFSKKSTSTLEQMLDDEFGKVMKKAEGTVKASTGEMQGATEGMSEGMQAALGTAMAAVGAFASGLATASATGSKALGSIMGGLQGAMSGFMAGGPVGAIIGGAAGILGGLFGGKSKHVKEMERLAEEKAKLELEGLKEGLKKAYQETVQAALQTMKEAAVLLEQLDDFTPLHRAIIRKFFRNLEQLLTEFVKLAEIFGADSVKKVQVLAEALGPITEAASNALTVFDKLLIFISPTEASIRAFGVALALLLVVFDLVLEGFEKKALKRAKRYAEKMHEIIAVFGEAADAFSAVTSGGDVPREALVALSRSLEIALNLIIELTELLDKQGLKRAALLSERAGAVVSLIRDSVEAFLAVRGFSEIPRAQLTLLAQAIRFALEEYDRAMAGIDDAAQAQSSRRASTANPIVQLFAATIEPFIKAREITDVPEAGIRAIIAGLRLAIALFDAEFKDLAVEVLQTNATRAEATKIIAEAIGGAGSLMSAIAQTQPADYFNLIAGVIDIYRFAVNRFIEVMAGLDQSAVAAAGKLAETIRPMIETAKSVADLLKTMSEARGATIQQVIDLVGGLRLVALEMERVADEIGGEAMAKILVFSQEMKLVIEVLLLALQGFEKIGSFEGVPQEALRRLLDSLTASVAIMSEMLEKAQEAKSLAEQIRDAMLAAGAALREVSLEANGVTAPNVVTISGPPGQTTAQTITVNSPPPQSAGQQIKPQSKATVINNYYVQYGDVNLKTDVQQVATWKDLDKLVAREKKLQAEGRANQYGVRRN
jgi:TP901 family phage tail tape measure protein